MKILWVSDSAESYTGYGIVTKNIVERMIKSGYDVDCAAFCADFKGFKQKKEQNGYNMYPIENYSLKDLHGAIKKANPDIVITLCDLFVLKDFIPDNVKWIGYFPIDGEPIPEFYRNIFERMHKRIAMCNYGRNLVEKFGFNCDMIYHGVNTKVFKPLDKPAIKEKYGFEDKFVVGSVGRNQVRKMYPRLLEAFKIFSEGKDDALLYLHTTPFSKRGHDLIKLSKEMGISGKVKFSNKKTLSSGYDFERMCEIYNLFDVHCLSTSGEGFGLTIIESMACCVPNIATDFTSCTELIHGRGELVKVKEFKQGSFGIKRALVDVDEFAKKLNLLYENEKLLQEYGKKGLDFAKKFDWDLVIKEWDRVLRNA